jgi:signal transduction histidine kinase/CheY-like chemotaxis protein
MSTDSVPVSGVTLALAALLILAATMAIGLVAMLRAQRHKIAAAHTEAAADRQLRALMRLLPAVVFILRPGRRFEFVAGDTTQLLGPDSVVGEHPFDGRVHPDDLAEFERLFTLDVADARAHAVDFRIFGDDGPRWITAFVAPVRLPNEEAALSGHFIDTTEVNAHKQDLRVARDVAERASKAKADFLATMSHEIRTPMNGVVGMLELLRHTRIDATQRELLGAVEDSAGVLMQILNDVLDFSRIEAGDMRLDPAPFDPRVLVDNVVGLMAAQARKKGLSMQVAIDAGLAGMLRGDSVRIRQILLNLLGNAGKFTEHGGIAVRIAVVGDDGHQQRLRISVADSGIGIAKEKQESVFAAFSQADSWTSRRYGGSGLGLAICKQLVELMGGQIVLESEPGTGTTVTVALRLPVERREAIAPPGLRGRHAVVRLAATGTATMLADFLIALGLSVERIPPSEPLRKGMAASLLFVGAEALDHAVFDDIGDISAHVIVVGDDAPKGRVAISENPFNWQALAQACVKAIDGDAAPLAGDEHADAPPVDAATGHVARILVAEDHPVGQQLIRRQLALLGWDCDIVDDGRQALDALGRNAYALLITDCNMPEMDGYELTRTWREHEATRGDGRHLPIVAMTAHASPGDAERCRRAGMDDYLGKPLLLDPLREKLALWTDGTAGHMPADDLALQDEGAWRRNMLALFETESRDDMSRLDHALASGDTDAASRHLHRILGALQLFTDDVLLADGRRLMESPHGNADWRGYVQKLRGLLARLGE